MAVSHALRQGTGSDVRSAMSLVDMDLGGVGTPTLALGSAMSLTVQTQLKGVDVDAAAAITYTSTGVQTTQDFMDSFVALLNSTLTGATARHSMNQIDNVTDKDASGNLFAVHIEPIAQVADTAILTLPTFVPA